VVASFCDRLVAEANRRGGVLTLQDIELLNEEFASKTEALQAVFEKSFEDYVRARERASFLQTRNYPFDRVLVRKFEHLFADGKDLDPTKLSRRMLPGFFMAMNKMLGPEVIETYQERCRKIVQRIRLGRDDNFDWNEISTPIATPRRWPLKPKSRSPATSRTSTSVRPGSWRSSTTIWRRHRPGRRRRSRPGA